MGHALLGIGGAICVVNFYLSFVRVPLLRARGVPADGIRFVSGIPLIGSALVAIGWSIGGAPWLVPTLLIAIDTGGPHWFLLALALQALKERGDGGV